MIKLSKRLQTISDMVTPGTVLCDVGCDHAYLDIYLLQNGTIEHALGMDVADGPLEIARQNLSLVGLEDKCEIRKSNGLINYEPGEANSLVIAGMGGRLIESILEASPDAAESFDELILSPHSEAQILRRYLLINGFVIVSEKIVEDENKYYQIMKVVSGTSVPGQQNQHRVDWTDVADKVEELPEDIMQETGVPKEKLIRMMLDRNFIDDLETKFGPCLLYDFLHHEEETLVRYIIELLKLRIRVLEQLENSVSESEAAAVRLAEVSSEIGQLQILLFLYKNICICKTK